MTWEPKVCEGYCRGKLFFRPAPKLARYGLKLCPACTKVEDERNERDNKRRPHTRVYRMPSPEQQWRNGFSRLTVCR